MSEKIRAIYLDLKPSGPILPFILFLIAISVFGTLYASIQRKLLHQEEEEDPCNPRYVFFSGLLNPFQKDPWGETEKKFKRCITSHMYRDPVQSKKIKEKKKLIEDREKEIQTTYQARLNDLSKNHGDWSNYKKEATKGLDIRDTTIDNVFNHQYTLHEDLTKNMVKLYYLMDAILRYMYTVITVRLSKEKVTLSIDDRHALYMNRYNDIYTEYTQAIDHYKASQYSAAYQKAQSAIQRYDSLREEIRIFRADHQKSRQYIQRGCHRMDKVFSEPDHCNRIFPRYKKDALAWGYS